MSEAAPDNLFTAEALADVHTANRKYQAALRAVKRAPYGMKSRREFELQNALHELLKAEQKLKELRDENS